MPTLDDILAQMTNDATTTKSASDQTPAASPSTEDAALVAVRNATKVASAPAAAAPTDAVAALHKMAAQTAAAEQEIMAKQAAEYGALMCDGFMSRLAAYDQAFGADKTASAAPVDLEQIKKAAYEQGAADYEKQAAAAYQSGYDTTMAQVHKIASDLHLAGQAEARKVLQALSSKA